MIKIGSEVGSISNQKIHSGIQRVTVELHKYLFKNSNDNFTINPVITNVNQKSSQYLSSSYLSSDPVLNKDVVELLDLDVLLLIDLNWQADFTRILKAKKSKPQLKVISIIYDLHPILNPEWFEGETTQTQMNFRIYLQKLFKVSDVIIVNSEKVSKDLSSLKWDFNGQIVINKLGAFIPDLLKTPHPAKAPNNCLVVGTIEPRKSHSLILDAFDELMKEGFDLRLFIVGRYGWKSSELKKRLQKHKEYGGRLRWFRNLTDAELSQLYQIATFTVAASQDEGFGLNVEESLKHGTPILVRNIPVFRERARDGIFFFDSNKMDLVNKMREMCTLEGQIVSRVRTIDDFCADFLDMLRMVVKQNSDSQF